MTEQLTATNNGRTLTQEAKEQFAYEIALGYFDVEQLRRRFKLQPQAFEAYCHSEEIADMVTLKKREIDESDNALKIHARRAARIVLEESIKLVRDPEASARTRMDAGKQIREIAAGVDKAVLKREGDSEGEGPMIIKTNLDLEGAKGVYAITAQEIAEQTTEHETDEDEINSLLGDFDEDTTHVP